jgi:hypothetical protein
MSNQMAQLKGSDNLASACRHKVIILISQLHGRATRAEAFRLIVVGLYQPWQTFCGLVYGPGSRTHFPCDYELSTN